MFQDGKKSRFLTERDGTFLLIVQHEKVKARITKETNN